MGTAGEVTWPIPGVQVDTFSLAALLGVDREGKKGVDKLRCAAAKNVHFCTRGARPGGAAGSVWPRGAPCAEARLCGVLCVPLRGIHLGLRTLMNADFYGRPHDWELWMDDLYMTP